MPFKALLLLLLKIYLRLIIVCFTVLFLLLFSRLLLRSWGGSGRWNLKIGGRARWRSRVIIGDYSFLLTKDDLCFCFMRTFGKHFLSSIIDDKRRERSLGFNFPLNLLLIVDRQSPLLDSSFLSLFHSLRLDSIVIHILIKELLRSWIEIGDIGVKFGRLL